ncbi:hypothetical protein ACYRFS_12895 [Listeria kieliensis]
MKRVVVGGIVTVLIFLAVEIYVRILKFVGKFMLYVGYALYRLLKFIGKQAIKGCLYMQAKYQRKTDGVL